MLNGAYLTARCSVVRASSRTRRRCAGAEGVVQDTSCCLPAPSPSKKVSLGAVQKFALLVGCKGVAVEEGVVAPSTKMTVLPGCVGAVQVRMDPAWAIVQRGLGDRVGISAVEVRMDPPWAIVRRGLGDRVGISFFFF